MKTANQHMTMEQHGSCGDRPILEVSVHRDVLLANLTGGDHAMTEATVPCPLLNKTIPEALCLSITYAAEGRIPRDNVSEIANWNQAERICADCVNAYWNRNNMPIPQVSAKTPD